MKNRKALTLLDVVVIIFIIMVLLLIFMPILNSLHKIAQRVVCETNLKGLGAAQIVYATDFGDEYTIQGCYGTPAWTTGTDGFSNLDKDWSEAKEITVGASLFLLVREADVSPKSFVCPSSDEQVYNGEGCPPDLDIIQLWDFGHPDVENTGPGNCVSYSYQMPYGPNGGPGHYAADASKSAEFAIMADKNPWYDPKLRTGTLTADNWYEYVAPMGPYYDKGNLEKWKIQAANAQPHKRQGQNVLYADGHVSFEKYSDAGFKYDNIYTRRGIGDSDSDIRIGNPGEMARYTIDNAWQPRDADDSFLVNDDSRLPPYPAP